MNERLKLNNTLKYIITFGIFFVIILIWFLSGMSQEFDIYVYEFLCSIRNKALDNFMIFISNLASFRTIIIISILFLIIPLNKKRYGFDIFIITGLQYLFNTIIKIIFKRPRIEQFILVYETSYSFPSAHTMSALAAYGFIIYILSQNTTNINLKIIIFTLLTSLILLIGFSRVYLGAHYFTDVIAALFLGISLLLIQITIYEKMRV